jgi:hypothetical protein
MVFGKSFMTADAGAAKDPKERRTAKLQFLLTGFTQDMGFRVFAFERMGEDRTRTKCTVRADLTLIRRYDIRLQELPLLCRSLLERCDNAEEVDALTFTEDEMCVHAKDVAVAKEAQKRKPPRRPSGENLGAAWRGPQAH